MADKNQPNLDENRSTSEHSHRRRAGLRPEERDPNEPAGPPGSAAGGVNMSGVPGGGMAPGGLAGSNFGDGSIEEPQLEEAHGVGIYDHSGDAVEDPPPFAGPSGGAVGGTPAEKRSTGKNMHRGIAPDDAGIDSTLGKMERRRKKKT